MYEGLTNEEARVEVLKQLPEIAKIDGELVTPGERERATGSAAAAATEEAG